MRDYLGILFNVHI